MNAVSMSRPLAIAVPFALTFGACAMILVPVAEAAARHKAPVAGTVSVTVRLPNTAGPPPEIVIKAYRSGTLESVGTCTLSNVLANADGSRYVVGTLRALPLNLELTVTVTTPVPKGLLSQPGFAHVTMFRVADEPMNISYGTTLKLTAAAPTARRTFYPEDMEVVPPLPPATGTPQAASPLPSASGSPSSAPLSSSSTPSPSSS